MRGAERSGWRLLVAAGLAVVSGGAGIARGESSPATIMVSADRVEQRVWPEIMGINLNPGAGPTAVAAPKVIDVVRKAGIASVRFPNGCVADRYDWKHVDDTKQISVDQFLDFCDAIGAEPYYTLNLQGGTENLEGPPPPGSPVEEAIRYRHTAPNPCGWTDYHFGTVAEAVELVEKYTIQRALEGKRPIVCYEMGNENWGQAVTDWPPEIYAATVAAYARAIRDVVAEARARHDELAGLKLHITAVGYPLMGNNQDPTQATNHEVNVRWTREVNRLYAQGLIDAVQDHFYPYSTIGTDYLVWSEFNLQNILYARRGVPNPLLDGYHNAELAFAMPIEITEWNAKCWGERKKNITGTNLDFENGLTGWNKDLSDESGQGGVRVLRAAGRRGMGVHLATGPTGEGPVRIFQVLDWKKTSSNRVVAAAWVRTDRPEAVALRVLPVDAEGRPDWTARKGLAHAWEAGHWQRLAASLKLADDATRFAVGLEVAGANASADVDVIEVFYWNNERGVNPAAVDTAAQQLFLVDAMRVMLAHGIRRAHLHHLIGGYPCGIMQRDGRLKDNYMVFRFFAGRLGSETVATNVQCETFDYDTSADAWATPFNALAPDVKNVPVLSALGMRDARYVYVLAVNRSTDRKVTADIS